MRVLGLKTENIKKVRVVEIHPTEPIVKISGDNGAGKSSVLDSIAYAIGGKRLIPENPIRDSESEAEIKVDLGDLKVTRTFKRKKGGGWNTNLKVTSDGKTHTKGQAVLDDLLGKLTFDPFAFSRMNDREQADLLKGMVDLGIDIREWELEYESLFDSRTEAKRDLNQVEASYKGMPYYDNAPEDPVSIADLTKRLEEVHQIHNDYANVETQLVEKEKAAKSTRTDIDDLGADVTELIKKLRDKEHAVKVAKETLLEQMKSVKETQGLLDKAQKELPDIAEVQERLNAAEGINQQVKANADRLVKQAETQEAGVLFESLDRDIQTHKLIKDRAIKNAVYPVKGLEFKDDSLLYNGIPLSQASAGESIMISTQIGMALNPKLKVLLIRNASLISENTFKVLNDLAVNNEYQIWCEYVDTTGEVGIYLEDGIEVAVQKMPEEPADESGSDPVTAGQDEEPPHEENR